MSKEKSIYIVNSPRGQTLVEATSQAQAIRTVVSQTHSARIAKPQEIIELMRVGKKSELDHINVIATTDA